MPRSGRSQSPRGPWVISGSWDSTSVFLLRFCPLSSAVSYARACPVLCDCVCVGGWHLPIYLIDFILLFSLSLCPKVPGSHHSSGPSNQSQDRGQGLLEAAPTLSLPPGLYPGLVSGLYWALGSGQEADNAACKSRPSTRSRC